jgi:hypothetical protein
LDDTYLTLNKLRLWPGISNICCAFCDDLSKWQIVGNET